MQKTKQMLTNSELLVATDFSGLGSPEEALKRLNVPNRVVFACERDKYARMSYSANHEPEIFYDDVTTRDNKTAPYSDLYVFGFPCQAFSIAGNQLGFEDIRGTLVFNSADYIRKKRPRAFMGENVKGLLSHDRGRTFRTIIDTFAISENGSHNMFHKADCLGYHVFYQVHNTKNYGIPQNRERIFIIGFRDEADALNFRQPKGFPLELKLKDLLQDNPNYGQVLTPQRTEYGKQVRALYEAGEIELKRAQVSELVPREDGVSNTLTSVQKDNLVVVSGSGPFYEVPEKYYLSETMLKGLISKEKGNQLGFINQDTQASKVSNPDAVFDTLCAGTHGYANGYVAVTEATKQGYAIAELYDSINLSVPTSTTRRGRVGKGQANTLDTQCNQAVVVIDEVLQINPSKEAGGKQPHMQNRVFDSDQISPAVTTAFCDRLNVTTGIRIRRLTPRECFRLQGYSDQFFDKCAAVNSDTQLYKQAGNSITVDTIMHIMKQVLIAIGYKFEGRSAA